MANLGNVRITQMGQLNQNQPFFEVVIGIKRYVFATDENGRVSFRNRAWLKRMGVLSSVCKQFQDTLDPDAAFVLNLSGDTEKDREKFPYQAIGTGFNFVPKFNIFQGWTELYPSAALPLKPKPTGQLW